MKTKLSIIIVFTVGILVGHATSSITLPQFRTGKTTRLLTTDLTGWCAGKEMTIEVNEFSPGTSGKHYHPAHSFTYVLEGSEAYAVEGQSSKVVHAGDVLHELPMQLHTVDN